MGGRFSVLLLLFVFLSVPGKGGTESDDDRRREMNPCGHSAAV